MNANLKKTLDNLTEKEIILLRVLFQSSKDNGHDFGFTEDARDVFPDPKTHPGVLASLQDKGLIDIGDPVRNDSGVWTQFNFGNSMEPDEEIINELYRYLEREQYQRDAAKIEADSSQARAEAVPAEDVQDIEEPPLQKFTIRVERVVIEFMEIEVEARDLGKAANLAETEARERGRHRNTTIGDGRKSLRWARVDESPVIKAAYVVYPVVEVDPHESRFLVLRDSRAIIVGRLVHNQHAGGWIFLTNTSGHGNGRLRRAIMEQAIPAWAKDSITMTASEWRKLYP